MLGFLGQTNSQGSASEVEILIFIKNSIDSNKKTIKIKFQYSINNHHQLIQTYSYFSLQSQVSLSDFFNVV